jgi:acyl carrier protein
MKELKQRIREIICQQFAVTEEQINDDSDFATDLNADSLDIVELIMAFEEEFNIEIRDEDTENLAKVKDVYEYIEKRIAAKEEEKQK